MNHLDILIGLASVFLTLSLIVTAIGEGISSTLKLKARTAEKIISTLIGADWCTAFYQHPNVIRLSQAGPKQGARPLRKPSYISPDIFVDVLLSLAATRAERTEGFSEPEVSFKATPDSPGEINRLLITLDSRAEGAEVVLARTLLEIWQSANFNLESYRRDLIHWFDDTANRSYGWHRRTLGMWLFGAGILVAVVMNADTIQIYKRISGDSALRDQLVKSALQAVGDKSQFDTTAYQCQLVGLAPSCKPDDFVRAASAELLPVIGGQSVFQEAKAFWRRVEVDNSGAEVSQRSDRLVASELMSSQSLGTMTEASSSFAAEANASTAGQPDPVTPEQDPTADPGKAEVPATTLSFVEWMIAKSFGLLLTACAISLGAPFWFDLLSKIVEVRGKIRTGSVQAVNAAGDLDSRAPTAGEAPAALTTLRKISIDQASLETLDNFEHDAPGFSPVNKLWCARLSSIAYLAEADAQLKIAGEYGALLRVFDSCSKPENEYDTQVHLVTTPRYAIVVFRGTEKKLADWLTNLDIELQTPEWEKQASHAVHSGFNAALSEVWGDLLDALGNVGAKDGTLPIWFTGHSLGGALATLAAQRLLEESSATGTPAMIAGLYTFGQPRVGNTAFARTLDKHLGGRYFRSVNNRDVVPRLPLPDTPDVKAKVIEGGDLKVYEYAHAGRIIYFSELGRAIMDPPFWYRSLDVLPVAGTASDIRKQMAETTGDHAISAYIAAHRALLHTQDTDT